MSDFESGRFLPRPAPVPKPAALPVPIAEARGARPGAGFGSASPRPASRPPAPAPAEPGPGWRPPGGRFLLTGFLTLAFLVFGLGGWGAFARISGAVIAPGTVEVAGNRQVVQHPTGGVVAAILARDGDRVEAGAPLLRFEGEDTRSELAVVEGQYFEVVARRSRLAAERDGLAAVVFDPELLARAAGGTEAATEAGTAAATETGTEAATKAATKAGPEAGPGTGSGTATGTTPGTARETALLLAAQVLQFETRARALGEETAQLTERLGQIGRQIDGLNAQREAAGRQAELVRREIASQEALFERGLTRQSDLIEPQRELARLEGTEGQIDASVAENRARLAEIEIEILRLTTELRREAIAELREIEFREIELRERRASLSEAVARLELGAPVGGVVYGSAADTLRAVIRPAEPIMYIVPEAAERVVRVRVEPVHIDQVRPGQEAILRFPAFNARTTPEVLGTVAGVSADAILDDRTGESFYRTEIRLGPEAVAELAGLSLLPGMPVEAYLETEPRSPISYLVKPFTDYFARAFRET